MSYETSAKEDKTLDLSHFPKTSEEEAEEAKIAEQDARLGWQYVRKYRRLPDGTLLCSKE